MIGGYGYAGACASEREGNDTMSIGTSILPRLYTPADALAGLPPAMFEHRTLYDFDVRHDRVGPDAFGWFQATFIVAAREAYRSGGASVLRRLWEELVPTDETLAQALGRVEPLLARMLTHWPGWS
jgi:hypothetical protein